MWPRLKLNHRLALYQPHLSARSFSSHFFFHLGPSLLFARQSCRSTTALSAARWQRRFSKERYFQALFIASLRVILAFTPDWFANVRRLSRGRALEIPPRCPPIFKGTSLKPSLHILLYGLCFASSSLGRLYAPCTLKISVSYAHSDHILWRT